ncbi:MAG: GGDEF domain-containing protein [Proteobacteria bacterium]|nr:GGDEF domain-containing protein [Pseudomonadota bacterium]
MEQKTALLVAANIASKPGGERESLLDSILQTIVDGIICLDSKGLICFYNVSAQAIFGFSENEVIGRSVGILMMSDSAERHTQYMGQYDTSNLDGVIGKKREVRARSKDGRVFPIEIAVGKMSFNGELVYTAIVSDITKQKKAQLDLEDHQDRLALMTYELEQANEELLRLSQTDGLTGLSNRRKFDEILAQEMRRGSRHDASVSLLLCDIDCFKQYNDHYGHTEGDKCLIQIAQCISDCFNRATDLCARYGGEEFAIILPDIEAREAAHVAQKVCLAVERLQLPHESSSVGNSVTLSIGVTTACQFRKLSENAFIDQADQALYQSKANGRNCVTSYSTPIETGTAASTV